MYSYGTSSLHKIAYGVYSNFRRNVSRGVPGPVFIEKTLEHPVIIINEEDNVNVIGPPDPISNLRPVIRKHLNNGTDLQKKLNVMQEKTQEWNENFWRTHNKQFIKERQEYINKHLAETEKKILTADEMSGFYKKFLDDNWERHVKYNLEWYRKNFLLLLFALRVNIEKCIPYILSYNNRTYK